MLVVDGNSLLHRSYHALAATQLRAPDGRPCWAVKGLWSQMLAAATRVGADAVMVAFDTADSVRTDIYPQYKAGRAAKHPDLVAQLAAAPGHVSAAGIHVVRRPGYEADDVVASAARRNTDAGLRTVIATSDRDAFALISPSVSVLRIVNGGVDASPLLTPEKLKILTGVSPQQYREFAAMRGDSSDNLPGVTGIGPKTAAKLLAGAQAAGVSLADVVADFDAGGSLLTTLVGKAGAAKFADPTSRQNLRRNLTLMAPYDDLDVGTVDDAALPLDPQRLDEELQRWALSSTAPTAAAVLAGVRPAAVPAAPVEHAPVPQEAPAYDPREYEDLLDVSCSILDLTDVPAPPAPAPVR